MFAVPRQNSTKSATQGARSRRTLQGVVTSSELNFSEDACAAPQLEDFLTLRDGILQGRQQGEPENWLAQSWRGRCMPGVGGNESRGGYAPQPHGAFIPTADEVRVNRYITRTIVKRLVALGVRGADEVALSALSKRLPSEAAELANYCLSVPCFKTLVHLCGHGLLQWAVKTGSLEKTRPGLDYLGKHYGSQS